MLDKGFSSILSGFLKLDDAVTAFVERDDGIGQQMIRAMRH